VTYRYTIKVQNEGSSNLYTIVFFMKLGFHGIGHIFLKIHIKNFMSIYRIGPRGLKLCEFSIKGLSINNVSPLRRMCLRFYGDSF